VIVVIIPIRCYSCGKVLAQHYEEFKKRTQRGEPAEQVLDDLGIKRYCCRRTIFAHVELIDEVRKFNI